MKKLLFIWEKLRSTFWFIPVMIIFLAVGMALLLLYLDSITDIRPSGIGQYLFTGSTDSARSILSTISGAMITVAGTVFSITLVALTLASSQFGPRLLRNFMHDRINQVVLGTYISTFVYCLIILNAIKDYDQFTFIPVLSILFAILAAVANILLLIIFIHHIAVSIHADNIISDIFQILSKNLEKLFPEELGEELEEEKEQDEISLKADDEVPRLIKSVKNGYLQYIDHDSIINFAKEQDLAIELFHRPGDYIIPGMEIGRIFSKEPVEKDIDERFGTFLLTGKTRTHHQDAEHSIHQMVEIASKALSPGINDPFTAIACIDNLASSMCYLSKVKFPSRYRYDAEGYLRVIVDTYTYEGMLDAAFNQIRQFGKSIPAVMIRLMEALILIHRFSRSSSQRSAIKRHARMVLNMAEKSFDEPNDLDDLRERGSAILEDEA